MTTYRNREKVATYNPRREGPEETYLATPQSGLCRTVRTHISVVKRYFVMTPSQTQAPREVGLEALSELPKP